MEVSGLTVVTELTLPAAKTETLKGVYSVNTGPSISTGVVDAVVNICNGKRRKSNLRLHSSGSFSIVEMICLSLHILS